MQSNSRIPNIRDRPYLMVLLKDLGCAALTTICEMVLPLIIRYITNTGSRDLTALTAELILKLAFLYFVLRIVDSLANFQEDDFVKYSGFSGPGNQRTGVFKRG